MNLTRLAEILHESKCSCVIFNRGEVVTFRERGVKDLFRILREDPSLLLGAYVADKVVGKGAAALMVLGGVGEVYADVISIPALEMLGSVSVPVKFGISVPNIINRTGDGICPVEKLCMECRTPLECLPLIENFIDSK